MKKIIFNLTLFFLLLSSISEAASKIGIQTDIGIPDGISLGLTIKPNLSWLRINVAGTYNLMAPGIRTGLILDPIDYVVSPVLSFEAGTFGKGTVPFLNKNHDISYGYINLHSGIEFGVKNKWKIFFHLGPSFISMKIYNFSAGTNNQVLLKDPSISVIVNPTAKIGIVYFF